MQIGETDFTKELTELLNRHTVSLTITSAGTIGIVPAQLRHTCFSVKPSTTCHELQETLVIVAGEPM